MSCALRALSSVSRPDTAALGSTFRSHPSALAEKLKKQKERDTDTAPSWSTLRLQLLANCHKQDTSKVCHEHVITIHRVTVPVYN